MSGLVLKRNNVHASLRSRNLNPRMLEKLILLFFGDFWKQKYHCFVDFLHFLRPPPLSKRKFSLTRFIKFISNVCKSIFLSLHQNCSYSLALLSIFLHSIEIWLHVSHKLFITQLQLWGRNKNSEIDQLHTFQSRALYQAVKIADLSGEKLSLFHTNNNWKFIFIYISSQLLKWYFVLSACNPCIHKSEEICPIIIFKGFLSLGLYSQTKQGFQSPLT